MAGTCGLPIGELAEWSCAVGKKAESIVVS